MFSFNINSIIILLVVFLSVVFMHDSLFAGTLSDFEKDIKKDDHKEKKSGDDSSLFDEMNELVIDVVSEDGDSDSSTHAVSADREMGLFSAGGMLSLERIEPKGRLDPEGDTIRPRKTGEALIPFFRFDFAYQDVEYDVSAWDYRFEGGYGPISAQFRWTSYDEKDPVDNLEVSEYHLMYRMSFSSQMEVDIGIGGMTVRGENENHGFSIAIPVLYHPSDYFGFEFRPVWSSVNETDIQDFDFSVLIGWRYVSFKAGYRWVRSPNVSLDGPQIGAAIRW